MNNREALESWSRSYCASPLKKDENGEYGNAFTNARWESWQAALAQANVNEKSQAQQTESQWISVDERLPEIGEEVIVFKPKSERRKITALARFIRYEEDTEYYWESSFGRGNMTLKGSVTHWMPLPPAPEGDKPASEENKAVCPKCSKPWEDHEFAVPAPYCP